MAFAFMDRLAGDESDELHSVIWRLYGPILTLSWAFTSWTAKHRFRSIILLIWYTGTLIWHGFLLLVTIISVLDNFNLTSLSLHYFLLMFFVSFSTIMYQYHRKTVISNHMAFTTDMGDHRCGRIYDDDEAKEIQKQNDREMLMFLMLPVFVGALSACALLVPYVKNLNREELYNPSGISMTLPVQVWCPYETHEGIPHAITVGLQLLTASSMGIIVVADLLIMLRVAQKIKFEYRILGYALSTLLDRAYRLYHGTHTNRLNLKFNYMDPHYQHCVGICLRDCVLHHLKISKLMSGFEIACNWPISMAYLIGTAVIGLSLINILSLWMQEDYETVGVFSALMVCEVLNMYIVSVCGESITTESERLRDELYFMEWHKLNLKNRKTFLNLQVGLTEPVVVKTGVLMNVCMDTFSSIMNSAYSFFNLMVGME